MSVLDGAQSHLEKQSKRMVGMVGIGIAIWRKGQRRHH